MSTVPHNADVIIIGAGAAGILAAWRASCLGAKVILLEKTSRIGTKILISGGGKCNVAHDGSLESVLSAFRPNEARFIRPACYRFTNRQIIQLFEEQGLEVYTRPDGRVFPVWQTAKDVIRILDEMLVEARVKLSLESPVVGLTRLEDGWTVKVGSPIEPHKGYRHATKGETKTLTCKKIIVCAGGKSYPNCGTTGDGWDWLENLGHTVLPPLAALAPIYLHWSQDQSALSGIALRDSILKARQNGKEMARWKGDLLLTHLGISGPTALGVSREVAEAMRNGEVTAEVDIVPFLTFESLTTHFTNLPPKQPVQSVLTEWMPARVADLLLTECGIERELPSSRLDRKRRNRLIESLKAWQLGPVRVVPLEKGEVTAGGVSLEEVNPHTMESLIVPGLFLAGEVLDVAGPVGGYNLQSAFATGYVAGEEAAKSLASSADMPADRSQFPGFKPQNSG